MQVLIAKIVESYNPAHGQPQKTAPSGDRGKSRPLNWLFTPVLAPLLLNRRLIGLFLGVGLTQLVLVASGWNGWQCPIKSTFGIICPGCGLSTAMALLARGQFAAAVGMHAYAPLFTLILALMVVAILLPADYLKRLSAELAILESKTGIAAVVMLSMMLYWLLRIFKL